MRSAKQEKLQVATIKLVTILTKDRSFHVPLVRNDILLCQFVNCIRCFSPNCTFLFFMCLLVAQKIFVVNSSSKIFFVFLKMPTYSCLCKPYYSHQAVPLLSVAWLLTNTSKKRNQVPETNTEFVEYDLNLLHSLSPGKCSKPSVAFKSLRNFARLCIGFFLSAPLSL